MNTKPLTPTNVGVANIPWNSIPRRNLLEPWFEHITFDDGKPHIQAMVVLADIIEWYQPRPVEDPDTGAIIGYERRFKSESLQLYSAYFEQKYGMSEKQVRLALGKLVGIGVVLYTVEAKVQIVEKDGAIGHRYNVPYIDLNVEVLRLISIPKEWQDQGGVCPTGHRGVSYRAQGCVLQGTHTNKPITNILPNSAQPELTNSSETDNTNGYFGLPGFRPDRRVLSVQTRLLEASRVGLTVETLRENAEVLGRIHGVTDMVMAGPAFDEAEYTKMQEHAIALASRGIKTADQIRALYASWMKEDGIGRKETNGGESLKPPKGNQLVKHASWLVQEGRIDGYGNIQQLPDGGSTASSGNGSTRGHRRVKTGVIGERTKAIEAARAEVDGDIEKLQQELQQWFETADE